MVRLEKASSQLATLYLSEVKIIYYLGLSIVKYVEDHCLCAIGLTKQKMVLNDFHLSNKFIK
jgi:hypothetical protein